ncbi:MAG: NifB/NifX family molybdenum-iron cluster-binding protein, partial [Candidatus Asgardarchaeia archaeon]
VLTIYWLDIAMTFIIILVGLRDGLYRVIRTYKGVKSEEVRAGILKRLENEFLMTPVFRSIKNAWIGVLGYFVYGNFTLTVTPLVTDELLQELNNFIISRTIRLVPHMISFGVTLERLDKDEVKIAVPVDEQGNVTSFDETNKFKIFVVSYPTLEVKSNEDITIEAPIYKIVPAQKARELALKKVDAIITKQISDLAENELKGWFVKIYITKTENIEEALRKL